MPQQSHNPHCANLNPSILFDIIITWQISYYFPVNQLTLFRELIPLILSTILLQARSLRDKTAQLSASGLITQQSQRAGRVSVDHTK